MDFLIHWPPGPVVATVQCQGLQRTGKARGEERRSSNTTEDLNDVTFMLECWLEQRLTRSRIIRPRTSRVT